MKHVTFLLCFLTVVAGLFHFYNLNWGSPYYFHPDERNVASAVTQLKYPDQMNPHFFAYGSLPIYTIYFTGMAVNGFQTSHPASPISHDPFSVAIFISRFFSSLFATLLIPILFFIGRKIKDETTGVIAALLAAASTGFMQFSHFGTFEMWLTFFSVLLFLFCLEFIEKKRVRDVLSIGLIFGILIAIKISSLALLPLPALALLFSQKKRKHAYHPSILLSGKINKKIVRTLLLVLGQCVVFIGVGSIIYLLTNPYVFLDTKSFLSTINYESSVGFNTLQVFYTQGFYDTIPVLYQFLHVYPFLLNPVMTFLFIVSFFFILFQSVKKKNTTHLLLLSFFLILFLSQAFLFIKWVRYLVPTLPFIFLIVALAFSTGLPRSLRSLAMTSVILINIIFALSYFITAFVQTDTRIAALQFAKKTIPSNAAILSEMYDLGIVPFNGNYPHITLFNTYDMDFKSPDYNQATWEKALASSNYIILPSQRVLQPRIQNPKKFPIGNRAYQSLQNGQAGFQKIYITPCDIYCRITYLGNPIYNFEQTASVFDRPTVLIFKKAGFKK